MPSRRFLAMLLAVALLALPATSFAQSAGDNQYSDPLGGQSGGGGVSGTPSGGSTGSAGSGSTSGSAGTTSSGTSAPTTTSAPTATTAGTTTSTTASGRELPRTGADPIIVAIFGVAMMLVGSGARLALPRRE